MTPEKRRKADARKLFEASALAWMFPIAIGIGFLWGLWMDRIFGTSPWLTGIFTLLGMIAAFRNLFRMAGGSDGGDRQSGE